MVIWVFDLDNTLYETETKSYSDIHKDNYLRCLLTNLEGDKYIFTNAVKIHARRVLHRLGILDLFIDIVDREQMRALKPSMKSYRYFISYIQNHHQQKIDSKTKIVFFEDSIENLYIPKKMFNWITVYISSDRNHSYKKYIDFTFRTIHNAVGNFSFHPEQCYFR